MAEQNNLALPQDKLEKNDRAREEGSPLAIALKKLMQDIAKSSSDGLLVKESCISELCHVPKGADPQLFASCFAAFAQSNDELVAGLIEKAKKESRAEQGEKDEDRVDEADDPTTSLSGFSDAAFSLEEQHWNDIACLKGTSDTFFYSREHMSDNFAHLLFLQEEGDDMATFIDRVRSESEIYPRPLKATSLTLPPFNMTLEHIESLFLEARETKECSDIEKTEASNGDAYYYSTSFISPRMAQRYAERHSVERFDRL